MLPSSASVPEGIWPDDMVWADRCRKCRSLMVDAYRDGAEKTCPNKRRCIDHE